MAQMQLLADAISLSNRPLAAIAPGRWCALYRHLRAEELVWEFRDMLLELEQAMGIDAALALFVPPEPRGGAGGPLDRLHDDWAGEDESSSFAFDVFTALALSYMKAPGRDAAIRQCLGVARRHAALLLAGADDNLRSRPYLWWMMANVLREGYRRQELSGNAMAFGDDRRGDMLQSRRLFPGEPLPIYAPVDDEAPEWRPGKTAVSDAAKGTTRTVLQAAADLGDVEMQAAYLQELMYQGQLEPAAAALGRLDALWLPAGCLRRLHPKQLFRYLLLADSGAARDDLRRDILVGGEFGFAGFPQYAQYMILRALTPRSREKEAYLSRARAVADASIFRHARRFEEPPSRRATDHGPVFGRRGAAPGAEAAARAEHLRSPSRERVRRRAVRRTETGGDAVRLRQDADRTRREIERLKRLKRRTADVRLEMAQLELEAAELHRRRRRHAERSDMDLVPSTERYVYIDAGPWARRSDRTRRSARKARVDDYDGSSDAAAERLFSAQQPDTVSKVPPGQRLLVYPEGRDSDDDLYVSETSSETDSEGGNDSGNESEGEGESESNKSDSTSRDGNQRPAA